MHADSELSDDTVDDRYYMDDYEPRMPAFHPDVDDNNNMSDAFRRQSVRLPVPAAENHRLSRDDILILPCSLTRMKVQIRSCHNGSETVRAAVVPDMRFSDVVRQFVPGSKRLEDVRAFVKLRGQWEEPGSGVRVSELVEQGRFVVNERGEVEVKIEIGGGGATRGVVAARAQGWKREEWELWA
jgi:hypothetical protein